MIIIIISISYYCAIIIILTIIIVIIDTIGMSDGVSRDFQSLSEHNYRRNSSCLSLSLALATASDFFPLPLSLLFVSLVSSVSLDCSHQRGLDTDRCEADTRAVRCPCFAVFCVTRCSVRWNDDKLYRIKQKLLIICSGYRALVAYSEKLFGARAIFRSHQLSVVKLQHLQIPARKKNRGKNPSTKCECGVNECVCVYVYLCICEERVDVFFRKNGVGSSCVSRTASLLFRSSLDCLPIVSLYKLSGAELRLPFFVATSGNLCAHN